MHEKIVMKERERGEQKRERRMWCMHRHTHEIVWCDMPTFTSCASYAMLNAWHLLT